MSFADSAGLSLITHGTWSAAEQQPLLGSQKHMQTLELLAMTMLVNFAFDAEYTLNVQGT